MVFLVLFAVKTGYLLGTDSLSGHRKETGEKKRGSPTFLTTGYPKTTLISWYVDCNTLIIWSNYSATSPKEAREKWLQICWDFVKLSEWWNDLVTFFFLRQCKNFFYSICAACTFFLPTSASRKLFFKITPSPPPSKVVKWSAPKGMFLLKIMIIYDMVYDESLLSGQPPLTLALIGRLLVPRGWHRFMEVQQYEIIVILIVCVKL